MASKNLAQNETIVIQLDKIVAAVAAVATRTGNSATAVVVLEARIDEEWVTPVTMINPLANPKVEVANLTGAAKSGWADLPGYRACRVRRTDGTGGDCWVELNVGRSG